ncbi:hypothetical protein ACOSP7_021107 [Xanthoceras sorbifolium]
MSSSSNQRHRKVSIGDPSNKRDRKSRPFDNILLDYEKFIFGKRVERQSDEATVAYQREVTKSSTSGRTKVWGDQSEYAEMSSSGDHDKSEGVVPGVEDMHGSSLAASRGLETKTGSTPFPSSVITMESLVELVHTFHLSRGYKVLISRVTNSLTHPTQGYVAISSHHLSAGLRFSLPQFLIRVLNLLEFAPMQFTLNAYARLLPFFLIFRRKTIGSPTDNILRNCF